MTIWSNGELYTPSAPKTRLALALLLFRANQLVDMDSLIDELWCENPPRSASTTAQTYIYQLRKTLRRALGEEGSQRMLLTHSPGYCLRISEDQLDVTRFEKLAREGRELFSRGHVESASQQLTEALSLWRGPVLVDVIPGRMLEAHIVHLEEIRLRTLQTRVQADLHLGRHRELVPELRSLVAAHPLNEWLHAQLINALNHSGRRGEALQAYQALRQLLHDDLGVEPSTPLQQLQRDLLNGEDRVLHPVA